MRANQTARLMKTLRILGFSMNLALCLFLFSLMLDEYLAYGRLFFSIDWKDQREVLFVCGVYAVFFSSIPPVFLFIKDFRLNRKNRVSEKHTAAVLDVDLDEGLKKQTIFTEKLSEFHPLKRWTILAGIIQAIFACFLANEIIGRISVGSTGQILALLIPLTLMISGAILIFYVLKSSSIKIEDPNL